MTNIDNMLKSILGKTKSKRQNLGFNIKKIIGNKRRGGITDWDGDGVKNWNDCQPFNIMRQDENEEEVYYIPGKTPGKMLRVDRYIYEDFMGIKPLNDRNIRIRPDTINSIDFIIMRNKNTGKLIRVDRDVYEKDILGKSNNGKWEVVK